MGKVIVIFSNPKYSSNSEPFPPIGAVGTVVTPRDEYGEYDVVFPDYPCSVGDPSWVTHENMIVFIDPVKSTIDELELEHAN